MCDWSRVLSGDWYFWFIFRVSKLVGFRCMGSSVWVHVCVHVWFSSVFDDSRGMFIGWHRAVCLAKQRMGSVDSKISVEFQWIYYLFIHVVLWWSACCLGTTGVNCGRIGQEGCLGETRCHVTVARTCSWWNHLLVTSIWEHVVGRWKKVVVGCEVVKKKERGIFDEKGFSWVVMWWKGSCRHVYYRKVIRGKPSLSSGEVMVVVIRRCEVTSGKVIVEYQGKW